MFLLVSPNTSKLGGIYGTMIELSKVHDFSGVILGMYVIILDFVHV